MLKKNIWYVAAICGLLSQNVNAASSPMVERHVFTPGQESEKEVQAEAAKILNPKELQKQLLFSGVIIGPKGKKALIRETGNKTADTAKIMSYSIGDQIKGMTIKDIGSKYIILAGQEGETKLNLYKGEKTRPSQPVIAPESPAQPPQAPGMMPQPNLPGNQSGPSQPPSPPGVGGQSPDSGMDKSMLAPAPEADTATTGPGSESPGVNPFADAMKKAGERRANRSKQPSGNVSNPFTNMVQ